jgi:hypothetical protein
MVGIVCERLSEDRHGNVNTSIEFHDGIVRPKNLPYFLPGNNFALTLHQDSQNPEGLLSKQDPCGTSFHSRRRSEGDEFTGSDVELKFSKSDFLRQIGRIIHGVAAKLPCLISSFPLFKSFIRR